MRSIFLFSTTAVVLIVSSLGFMCLNNRITHLEGSLLFHIYCVLVIDLI